MTTETAMTTAAATLGIELKYPDSLKVAVERRTATQALYDSEYRDAAAELRDCPKPRNFTPILKAIADHNLIVEQGKRAIQGGVHVQALSMAEHEFTRFVPDYADQLHAKVSAVLTQFVEAANNCPTLDAPDAITGGYGEHLTQVHLHGQVILEYLAALTSTGTTRAEKVGNQLAGVVAPSRPIAALHMSKTQHRAQVSEVLTSRADVDHRDTAHRIVTGGIQNMLDTLRRVARGEYEGYSLDAATGQDYSERVTSFQNVGRTVKVPDSSA